MPSENGIMVTIESKPFYFVLIVYQNNSRIEGEITCELCRDALAFAKGLNHRSTQRFHCSAENIALYPIHDVLFCEYELENANQHNLIQVVPDLQAIGHFLIGS